MLSYFVGSVTMEWYI